MLSAAVLTEERKALEFLKLPSEKLYKEWRKSWLNEITKSRVVDQSLKNQIQKDKVYTCEKHFDQNDIEICKYIIL